MFKTIVLHAGVLLVLILLNTPVNSKSPRDEDPIDPTDILNFDQVNMRMTKESGKSQMTPEFSDSPIDKNHLNPLSSQDGIIAAEIQVGEKLKLTNDDNSATVAESQLGEKLKLINDDNSIIEMTALLRQYIMMLVENLESQVANTNPVPINLRLKVSKHDIYKLKEYGQRRLSGAHEVFEVLSHIIQYASKVETAEESNLYWLEERLGLCCKNLFLILALVLSIMLLLKLIQNTVFTKRLITQTMIVLFFLSVVFTWIEKYQEVLADQERIIVQKYSSVCKHSEDQSFVQRALSYVESQFSFKDDKCQEFHKARFVNPVIKVSPMDAVAVAIVKTLVSPVGIVGTTISHFLTSALKDLPVHWQLYVAGFMFVLVIFITCLISGCEIHSFFFSIQRSRCINCQMSNQRQMLMSAQARAQVLQNSELITYQSIPNAIDRSSSAAINRTRSDEINRLQYSAEIPRTVSTEIHRSQVSADIHRIKSAEVDRLQVLSAERKNITDKFDQSIDISDTGQEFNKSEIYDLSLRSHFKKPRDNGDEIVEDICEQPSQLEISSKLSLEEDTLTNHFQQLDISTNNSVADSKLATDSEKNNDSSEYL